MFNPGVRRRLFVLGGFVATVALLWFGGKMRVEENWKVGYSSAPAARTTHAVTQETWYPLLVASPDATRLPIKAEPKTHYHWMLYWNSRKLFGK